MNFLIKLRAFHDAERHEPQGQPILTFPVRPYILFQLNIKKIVQNITQYLKIIILAYIMNCPTLCLHFMM